MMITDSNQKYALLVIDILNDFNFKHGKTLATHTQKIVEPLLKLTNYSREKDIPVIYINDHYGLWQANLDKIYNHCQNEVSNSIIKPLCPNEKDYFLIKPKHSAFFGTALHMLLHEIGVNTLIITGVAGNICVLFTANDAYMRNFNLIIPEDCVASVSNEDNLYALKMMKNVLSATIIHSSNFFEK
jgi:nicotinamidase-related amidase